MRLATAERASEPTWAPLAAVRIPVPVNASSHERTHERQKNTKAPYLFTFILAFALTSNKHTHPPKFTRARTRPSHAPLLYTLNLSHHVLPL